MPHSFTTTIKRQHGEYIVRLHDHRLPIGMTLVATYYTPNKQDAKDTASNMIHRAKDGQEQLTDMSGDGVPPTVK